MMNMAPNTPFGLKLFCEAAITSPKPFWAGRGRGQHDVAGDLR
jgi:hypothetical protein